MTVAGRVLAKAAQMLGLKACSEVVRAHHASQPDETADRAERARVVEEATRALRATLAARGSATRGEMSDRDMSETAVTLATVEGWRRELVLQARLEDGSLMRWQAVENPRLEITRIVRRGQDPVTTFVVDGHACADLDDVLRRLNEPPADEATREL